mgnify:CR=1 FL=1
MHISSSRSIQKGLVYVIILIAILVTIVPVLEAVRLSLLEHKEVFSLPPKIPLNPNLENYVLLFSRYKAVYFFKNSIIIASIVTVISLLAGSIASYSLSRYYSGKTAGSVFFTAVGYLLFIPPVVTLLAYFEIMSSLKLIDSIFALIIPYCGFNVPLAVWFLKGFFDQFPRDIEDSALVDGCSRVGVFFRIVLPLVMPGIIAVGILIFIMSWNEFLLASFLTRSYNSQTVPILIASFRSIAYGVEYEKIAAAIVLSIMPALAFSFFIRKYLVRGLTAGAVRG